MSHDTNMLRAKLRQAMDRVGKTNGHAMPPSTSNVDPILHELFVAGEAVAYWKTRHDDAKEVAMQAAGGDTLAEAVQSVIDLGAGTSVTLAEGDLYTMTCDISKAASRLDQRALRNYMQTELGLSAAVVNKAFDACSVSNAPAKKVKVSSR